MLADLDSGIHYQIPACDEENLVGVLDNYSKAIKQTCAHMRSVMISLKLNQSV